MHRRLTLAALAPVLLLGAVACSSDDDEPAATGDTTATTADAGGGDGGGSGTEGACPAEPFTGTISSDGDDDNAPFSLTDGDVATAVAYPLSAGTQYTVYLSDGDLGGQTVGLDTIEAADGEAVITMQARNPEGEPIEVGTAYDETFVIMDSGGGAQGSPSDPTGTVTFLDVGDDRICFEVDFADPGIGQVLQGTVSAEVAG